MTNYEQVRDSRHKRKLDVLYVMGEKCKICGYSKAITALELHHLNPEEKDFTLGQCWNKSWDDIHKEIQKCILVCANCHREIHEGLIQDELKTSYIKERGEEITQKNYDLKHHKICYCKSCGKEIYKGSEYCVACAGLKARIVERPTREELKRMIRIDSFVGIGKRYCVSDNAVRKWCKTYQLPNKKSEINAYSDEEWEKI